MWLDIVQFNTNSYVNGQLLTHNTVIRDFTGNEKHLHVVSNGVTPSTITYYTNGPYGSFLGDPANAYGPLSNGLQRWLFQTNAAGFITNGTIAVRSMLAASASGFFQTATVADRFAYVQAASGNVYFDWGPDREQRAYPADFTTVFYNIICVHDGATQTIYLQGTNYVSGASTNTLTSAPGNTDLVWNMLGVYHKRALTFSYALSPTEVTNLSIWMTTNSP